MHSNRTYLAIGGALLIAVVIGAAFMLRSSAPATDSTPAAEDNSAAPLPASSSGIPPPMPGSNLPAVGKNTPPPPGGSVTYRNEALGIAFRYLDRYYNSSTRVSPEGTHVWFHRTADRSKADDLTLTRLSMIELTAYPALPLRTLDDQATRWGESYLGTRFRVSDQCRSKSIGGDTGLSCSFYAGADRGGYRAGAFVAHDGTTYRLDANASKSDDQILRDFETLLGTVSWTD